RFPPAPTTPVASVALGCSGGATDGFGEGRFGLRSDEEFGLRSDEEMVVSGGLRVYGSAL
ncbi:MAG: hypothetical protein ACREJK_11210, partial [Candidatus Methylomirabilales bacterium]